MTLGSRVRKTNGLERDGSVVDQTLGTRRGSLSDTCSECLCTYVESCQQRNHISPAHRFHVPLLLSLICQLVYIICECSNVVLVEAR